MDRNAGDGDTRQAAPDRLAGIAGTAFWRFSLALYARPGVADALLALQDRAGLDVNLILFGLWLGARYGIELGSDGFAAAAEAVTGLNRAVRDLRALRRRLGNAEDRDTRCLRRALLRVELAAERRVQHRLAAWFATATPPQTPGDRRAAADANLARCLGPENGSSEAALLCRELAALRRHA